MCRALAAIVTKGLFKSLFDPSKTNRRISKYRKITVGERDVRHSLKTAEGKGRAYVSRLWLLLLLFLVPNTTGINSLLARNSSLTATPHSRNGNGGLIPPAINLPQSISFGEAFATLVSAKDSPNEID